MIPILKKILNILFYSPRKHIKNLCFVKCDDEAIILGSTRFSFYQGQNNFQGSISIGKNSMIGCDFIFESNSGGVLIGEGCFINGGTKLISRSLISIGSDVTIAWGCTIYDHNSHSLDWRDRRRDNQTQVRDYLQGRDITSSKNWEFVKARPIRICDKAWIGFDCIILSGVTIGEGAIVGAGSVIRKDVEPWTVVGGNPPIVLAQLKEC